MVLAWVKGRAGLAAWGFLGSHGVAELQNRGLRHLFGEAEIPLPGLPRALVSWGSWGLGSASTRPGGRPGLRAGGRLVLRPGAAGRRGVLRPPGLTAPVFLVTAARSLVSRSTKVRKTLDRGRSPRPFLALDRAP